MDEPKTRFSSDKDKMVARAPILEGVMRTVTFKTDMMKVCGDKSPRLLRQRSEEAA